MDYLIAVLSDRLQAEAAYTALEKAGLEPITILGKGYRTAQEFGFVDPNRQARQRALQMSYWLLPFGFVAGYAFNLSTQIELFPWAGPVGNHIIGGIFGAIAGVMGSVFVGGGLGLSAGSGDDLPYHNRLNAGKYLVVVGGTEMVKSQAHPILQDFQPESLQFYSSHS